MPNEEAIRDLKKLKSFHNGSYGEACNMAIEALEKQIPKKPVVFTSIEKSFRCPNCETEIMSIDKVNCQWGHKQLYCECCGQSIDWSEDND